MRPAPQQVNAAIASAVCTGVLERQATSSAKRSKQRCPSPCARASTPGSPRVAPLAPATPPLVATCVELDASEASALVGTCVDAPTLVAAPPGVDARRRSRCTNLGQLRPLGRIWTHQKVHTESHSGGRSTKIATLLSLRRKLPPLAALPSCDGCYRCHVGQDPLEEIASVRARRACASLRVPIVCTSATPQSVWLPGRPPYPMLEPVPLLMELVFGKDLHHRRSGFQPPAEDMRPLLYTGAGVAFVGRASSCQFDCLLETLKVASGEASCGGFQSRICLVHRCVMLSSLG